MTIQRTKKPLFILRVILLCFILFVYANGTIGMVKDISFSQKAYQKQHELIHNLLQIGATHVYTEYWTCYRIAFESNEKIDCVSLTSSLHIASHRENRYPPYTTNLKKASDFVYVFPISSPQAQTMAQKLKLINKKYYTKYTFDDYFVYRLNFRLN
ncbi:hypothetical protein KDA_67000 [Dictyobacter alpinus]|uniref:Uncharacterized protein n=1 Tax=Dictyobacter alpinus TaxID=2014873 RepID=A0A402BIR2_9CHLR|nr:hypothetical protein KDA_67000 [Dictyobacter alpinus]